ATGRGHGSSPSARPLPVSLRSDLHHLPGPRPGDWWPSPADVARRYLVGWRACRGAGRSRPASTRRPHSRPAPRGTVTSCIGARGGVTSSQEKLNPMRKEQGMSDFTIVNFKEIEDSAADREGMEARFARK